MQLPPFQDILKAWFPWGTARILCWVVFFLPFALYFLIGWDQLPTPHRRPPGSFDIRSCPESPLFALLSEASPSLHPFVELDQYEVNAAHYGPCEKAESEPHGWDADVSEKSPDDTTRQHGHRVQPALTPDNQAHQEAGANKRQEPNQDGVCVQAADRHLPLLALSMSARAQDDFKDIGYATGGENVRIVVHPPCLMAVLSDVAI